jgi:hypothetical protein
MLQQRSEIPAVRSSLDGLWVLLVQNQGQLTTADIEGRVPMLARAGNEETYLLGFKNAIKAREFMTGSAIENAEPRLVVRANKEEYLRIAQAAGACGVLVDYNPSTQEYGAATELF